MPMTRTRATAAEIFAGAGDAYEGIPLELDERIRERCFGVGQGFTRDEVRAGKACLL